MTIGSLIRKTVPDLLRSIGLWRICRLPKKAMRVFEYTLQYFATYSSQLLVVYPASLHQEIPPNTIDNGISWKFLHLFKRTIPEAFVVRLPNGRVQGTRGTIITPEGILLRDVSREFGKRHQHGAFQRVWIGRPQKLSGNVAVLITEGANTYYHWIFDILPRLHLLEEAGLLSDIDYFILPKIHTRFQKESFRLMNIHPSGIIEAASEDFHVQAENLFVPSLPSLLGTVNNWACAFLQQKFLLPGLPEVRTGEKIYISRSKAPNRRVTNEHELTAVLQQTGFDIIRSEEYTFLEQVAIFNKASIVVAPHGSGLSNIVFCRPGTIVIELFNSDCVVPCFWIIANNCQLKYFYISHKEKDSTPYLPYWEGKSTDFAFPKEKLEQLLQQLDILQ